MKFTLRKIIKAFVPYGILWYYNNIYIKNKKSSTKIQFKKIVHKDYKYPIMVRNGTTDIYVYNEIILQEEYKFETKTEPKIIIDAGANIGLITVYFANKYPNATIVAIEPEESNYEMLVKNTKNYSNVKTIKAALFDKIGKIDLLDVGCGNIGFMTEMNNNYQQIKINSINKINVVDSITINKILEDYDLSEIDILKMDIEGAEKEVFSNASEWICKVKSIIIELHERIKTGCNRTFYCNTNCFDNEWQKGRNIYLTRENYIKETSYDKLDTF
jgi:FkbM family methyltransferase